MIVDEVWIEGRNLANRLLVLGIIVPRSADFAALRSAFTTGAGGLFRNQTMVPCLLHAGVLMCSMECGHYLSDCPSMDVWCDSPRRVPVPTVGTIGYQAPFLDVFIHLLIVLR